MRELSLHILDIVQNSIAAGAEVITVVIKEEEENNQLVIKIADDGCGMTAEEQTKVIDPFVTSRQTREVGLGLPLLKEAAEQCAGSFQLSSQPGAGTTVVAEFEHDHIDRAPLGDMVGTIITVLNSNPKLELVYRHQVGKQEFVFDTRKIKEELADVPINNPQILNWLRDYLTERLTELRR